MTQDKLPYAADSLRTARGNLRDLAEHFHPNAIERIEAELADCERIAASNPENEEVAIMARSMACILGIACNEARWSVHKFRQIAKAD